MEKRIIANSDTPAEVAREAARYLGGDIDRVVAAFPATVAGVYNDAKWGDIIVTPEGYTAENLLSQGENRLLPLP